MTAFFRQAKDEFKRIWIYNLCFILLFNFIFLPRLVDGGETFGMFIIASFFLQLAIFALHPLTIAGLSYLITPVNNIAKAIILFLIFEMALLLFIGNISLFGLFEVPVPNVPKELQSELLSFHKSRDFALSMSSLISVAIYFIAVTIKSKGSR